MGLFSSNKKKEEVRSISQQQMPKLPEFPSLDEDSGFPRYESTVADIKKEVGNSLGEDTSDIPIRNQRGFGSKTMMGANMNLPKDFIPPKQEMQMAPSNSIRRVSIEEDKPLFIRIDRYKNAMHTLDTLKDKLEDAEHILRDLDNVRSEEEEKIKSWKRDLQSIKEKLSSIDKNLFEV
ncbi:hypothetical protein J4216_00895 [Candidatus Woesearchaeota archaeon]|nr:hypothetical protein [Candidatus Woesearchaeota archaeon]